MNLYERIVKFLKKILPGDPCSQRGCAGYYCNSDDYGWDHSTTYKKCNICNHIKEEK